MSGNKTTDTKSQYETYHDYICDENLGGLFESKGNLQDQDRVYDRVRSGLAIPFPPEIADLVRLHKLVRTRKPFTVLEFGVGSSTLIMADALYKNVQEWEY